MNLNHRGIDFVFDAGPDTDFIGRQIRQNQAFFEQPLLDYILKFFPKHATILDIGANFGNHTLFFSRFLEHKQIVCFEPNLPTFELLRANVGDVALCKRIALGDKECRANGTILEADNAGTFTLTEDPDGNIVVRPLDSYAFEDVTLMKIDAECMELQVIKGGMQTITRCRPLIFAEGHGHGYMAPITELLEPLGYSLRNMSDVSPELGTTWMLLAR